MKILHHDYRHLVRIEIKDLYTTKAVSVTLVETTFEEVLGHVKKHLPITLEGTKVRVSVRENHPEKQWGRGKSYTTYICDLKSAMDSIVNPLI